MITDIRLSRLNNAMHEQFHIGAIDIFDHYADSYPSIKDKRNSYKKLINDEQEAMRKYRKSYYASEIDAANISRCNTFRGLRNMVEAYAYHPRPENVAAAKSMLIAIKPLANIQRFSNASRSTALNTLLVQLNGQFASEVARLNLGEWLVELQKNNEQFVSLIRNRDSERAMQTQLVVEEVRIEVDAAYRALCKHLNALITLGNEADFEHCVAALNNHSRDFRNNLAKHLGHLAAKRNRAQMPEVEQIEQEE